MPLWPPGISLQFRTFAFFSLLKCVSFGLGIGYLLVLCCVGYVTPALVSYLFSFLDSVVLAAHGRGRSSLGEKPLVVETTANGKKKTHNPFW